MQLLPIYIILSLSWLINFAGALGTKPSALHMTLGGSDCEPLPQYLTLLM